MRDAVELLDADIRVLSERKPSVLSRINDHFPWKHFADLDSALGFLDLYAAHDETGALVGLERDAYDDSFPGEVIWNSLAAGAESGNSITWRETYDGRIYRTVFDGRGGFRNVGESPSEDE